MDESAADFLALQPALGGTFMSPTKQLSVIILTYNEAIHITRAIHSVTPLSQQTYAVDSYSSDGTEDLARSVGAIVAQHEFVTQAQQFQWALDNLPIETEWVMRLDADEVLTSELVKEISQKLPQLPPDVTGVNLKRRHIFLDRWIKHGGRYPLTLLRIWRRGAAKIEQRWMDEHMVLLHGRAVTFDHDFSDHNLNDLTFFTAKHNKYATREAIDVLVKRYRLGHAPEQFTAQASSTQAAVKRWIKERLYNRLPFWAGPLGYFLFRYVFQFGFLDGPEGLVYHFLQGFWYRFLVGAKVLEFDRSLRHLPNGQSRTDTLARLTGYRADDIVGAAHNERL